MPTQKVFIPSIYDRTPLETIISYNPRQSGDPSEVTEVIGVVLTHPYAPLGGTMLDHLVHFLHDYFLERRFIAASFNFRGAGRSGGSTTWTAHAEIGDCKTIIDFLLQGGGLVAPADKVSSSEIKLPRPSRIIIVGYSFGSMIASAIDPASYPGLNLTYILISYPLNTLWALAAWGSSHFRARIDALTMPVPSYGSAPPRVLLVMGTIDNFTGIAAFRKWVGTRKREGLVVREVEGADHFWFGKEDEIVEIVGEFLGLE